MKTIINKIKTISIKNLIYISKQLLVIILLILIGVIFTSTISSSINLGDDFYIISKMKFIIFLKDFETKWFIFFIIVAAFILIYQIHIIIKLIKPNKVSTSFDIVTIIIFMIIIGINISFSISFNNLYLYVNQSNIEQNNFWLFILLSITLPILFLIGINIIDIFKNKKVK